ncbi:MAG: hypothetical protein NTX25_20095, partial [Proteobacteria bacterium]|nr:hypothetical protein [Pseudomonadota bacterium]
MKHVQASVFMMFFMTLASAVAGTGRAETVFLHPFSSKKERSFNFAGKESLNFESDRRMPLSLRSKTDMILESKG